MDLPEGEKVQPAGARQTSRTMAVAFLFVCAVTGGGLSYMWSQPKAIPKVSGQCSGESISIKFRTEDNHEVLYKIPRIFLGDASGVNSSGEPITSQPGENLTLMAFSDVKQECMPDNGKYLRQMATLTVVANSSPDIIREDVQNALTNATEASGEGGFRVYCDNADPDCGTKILVADSTPWLIFASCKGAETGLIPSGCIVRQRYSANLEADYIFFKSVRMADIEDIGGEVYRLIHSFAPDESGLR